MYKRNFKKPFQLILDSEGYYARTRW